MDVSNLRKRKLVSSYLTAVEGSSQPTLPRGFFDKAARDVERSLEASVLAQYVRAREGGSEPHEGAEPTRTSARAEPPSSPGYAAGLSLPVPPLEALLGREGSPYFEALCAFAGELGRGAGLRFRAAVAGFRATEDKDERAKEAERIMEEVS